MVKNLPANSGAVGDMIPGSRKSPGGGNGNPLRYSCLGNLTDRGAWPAMGLHRMGYNLVTEHTQVEMATQRIAIGKKKGSELSFAGCLCLDNNCLSRMCRHF